MRLVVLFTLLVLARCAMVASTVNGNPYTYFSTFVTKLTTVTPNGERVVQSSGGVAGGVVSEGQGYGLLVGGITAVALGPTDPKFSEVVNTAYQFWTGWKKMCILSNAPSSCQQNYCNNGQAPCLPHWKFDSALTSPQGTGSATDGDEDAIVGMILLLGATEANPPAWWTEVKDWAYQSCLQLFDSGTILNSGGNYRLLRLGSCWGGWDCNNPSYWGPGAYRVFRNFMARYGPVLEATNYVSKWNNLILSTYATLKGAQCDVTGLTTNWYVPDQVTPTNIGTTGCSGSGTPSAEFGAEASRGVWRVAIDNIWFPNEPNMDGYNSTVYSNRVSKHVMSKFTSPSTFAALDTGCLVTSILSVWNNAFMYGPVIASLTVPNGMSNQQAVLDAAGAKLVGTVPDGYFPVSWYTISALTLSGALERAKSIVSNVGSFQGDIYKGLNATVQVKPTTCSSPTAQVVFSDFFNPSFDGSRSWGTFNLNDQTKFHSGVSSISQVLKNYEGLQLRCISGNCIDTATYSSLSFWIYGNNAAGSVRVKLRTSDVEVGQTILANYASNTWTYHSYNLSTLASGASFNVIQFQDNTGATAGPTVYYDDVIISCENIPSPPVAPPSSSPVAPPTASPVAPPTASPVAPPTASPVAPPTASPVAPPTASPVAPPTASPVAPPTASPVAPPTASPVAPPTASPVAPPTASPISPPSASPVAPPSNSPVAPPSNQQSESSGLSGGAIAGIVIGVCAALAIIGCAIYFVLQSSSSAHATAERV